MTKQRIGFIGLGVMGAPMCRNLCRRLAENASGDSVLSTLDSTLLAFDLNPDRLQSVIDAGAQACESIAALVSGSDVVMLSLPGGPEVEAVLREADGVFENARDGALIIDFSTTPVSLTRELAEEAGKRGLRYLDSPVARTREAAEKGTLAMMVGGSKADFDNAQPILSCMASDVLHTGETGCGQMAKILNNMVLFQTVAALAEAQTMANRAGMSTESLFDALAQGSANSFALANHGRKAMMPGEFPEQAFSVEYARKDLSYARELAADTATSVSGADNVDQLFEQAIDSGWGEQYWPVISKLSQQTDKTQ